MTSTEYKTPDRAYVAQQFDGPVIKAFIKAVYNFFHKDVDAHADYYRNMSISTANTSHLYFIGKLMGLQLFSLFTDAGAGMYIVYTDGEYDTEEYEYNNGMSNNYEAYHEGAGVFGTGAEKDFPVTLTDAQYKAVLNALATIDTVSSDSILLIDTMTHSFLDSNDYTLTYNSGITDVINLQLGESIGTKYVTIIQHMFDNLLKGGTTVYVTRI